MDENMVKFTEKLNDLKALARKKKNVLEITEINDFFADMELNSDQMDKVFEYLEANNIDVLRMDDDDEGPADGQCCLIALLLRMKESPLLRFLTKTASGAKPKSYSYLTTAWFCP